MEPKGQSAPGGGDYDSLRRCVDEQLTLAKDRIESQRDDYLKLKDVVEERFNHRRQAPGRHP